MIKEGKTQMKCPVCYVKKTILTDKKLSVYKCINCNHFFTVIPREKQEKYSDEYFEERHKNWFDNPNYKLFNYVDSKILKLLPDKHINLIDVGCGKGDFLLFMLSKHPKAKLTGIDLVKNIHPKIHFTTGDFIKKDIKGKFNVVSSFMVIEHLNNPHLFMKKTIGILKKNGIVVINTFNSNSLIFRISRILKLGFRGPYERLYSPHHLQHYTSKSLRKLIEMNNMKVLVHRKHNYPLKAVDVPKSNFLAKKLYKIIVAMIFLISEPFGMGIEHTIVCKR